MNKPIWVGVDVGKRDVVAAIAIERRPWPAMRNRSFSHSVQGLDALCRWVAQNCGDQAIAGVCIESTGALAWRFVEGLNGRLGPVSMVNPRFISDYGKSLGIGDKTDRVDACIMASYGQAVGPQPRPAPSANQRQLKKLHSAYEAAQVDWHAWNNRLNTVGNDKELAKTIRAMLRSIECMREKLDAQMRTLIENDERMRQDVERMKTIPGVAEKTARTLLAHLGDLRQYKRTEITALAGLYPRRYESGTSVYRRPRLVKAGKQQLRRALYFPAITAIRHNPLIAAFAQRLRKKGMAPKAIVVAAMRKLLILIRGVIISGKDFQTA